MLGNLFFSLVNFANFLATFLATLPTSTVPNFLFLYGNTCSICHSLDYIPHMLVFFFLLLHLVCHANNVTVPISFLFFFLHILYLICLLFPNGGWLVDE